MTRLHLDTIIVPLDEEKPRKRAKKSLYGKPYHEYLIESRETNKKILARYGAPLSCKVPTPIPVRRPL